eukprot:473575-Pyramimonas_sp.AAC.1
MACMAHRVCRARMVGRLGPIGLTRLIGLMGFPRLRGSVLVTGLIRLIGSKGPVGLRRAHYVHRGRRAYRAHKVRRARVAGLTEL